MFALISIKNITVIFLDFLPIPQKNQVLGITHCRIYITQVGQITSKFVCSYNDAMWMQNGVAFEDMQFGWRGLEKIMKLC